MTHRRLALTLCFLLAAPATLPAEPARGEEKGTFLGLLFSPVPEPLYDQLPNLPRNAGVLVTLVLPDSPAARADLRRHDVLYQYDDVRVRDCEHFVGLIRDDRPGRTVRLAFLREGRQKTVDVTLTEGPVLKIAQAGPAARDTPETSRERGRQGRSVSVAATPLEDGKMKVTIAYYQAETGRLRTITCQGAREEIDGAVKRLPLRERSLVQVALERIRELSSKKTN
jgi:hypothetical protein